MPRPEVTPGDRWVYRRIDLFTNNQVGRPNFTVAFANKDVINAVLKRGQEEIDVTFTSEWNVVNDPSSGVYNPHSGLLKFPLVPGATWRARYDLTRMRQGAFRAKWDVRMKAVGWEEVEVPAGKFRALRVEGNGDYVRQDVFGSGTGRYVFWYAPQVKRWVKYTYEGTDFKGNPNVRQADELVEFKLQ